MTETIDPTEDPTVDAFILDTGEGVPGVVPALVLDTDPLRLAVSYRDGTIREVGAAEAPLPAADVAAIDTVACDDDTAMWVVSLTTTAPVGTWTSYWAAHCPRLYTGILGEWLPDRAVPALHIRGTTVAGAAATVSVPLTDPSRYARVDALIETDQQRLLDEIVGW